MNADQETGFLGELRRIRSSAWLALALLLLLALLDGPVTTLGWMFLGAAILSILYIGSSSTIYFIRKHSRNQQ
jgi:hypothetical protein